MLFRVTKNDKKGRLAYLCSHGFETFLPEKYQQTKQIYILLCPCVPFHSQYSTHSIGKIFKDEALITNI